MQTFTDFKMRISSEDLRRLEEQLEKHPDNIEYLDWAAFAYYSNGSLDKAEQAYRRLISIRPDNASYHYYLGNSLFKKGDVAAACLEWRKVLRIDVHGHFAERCRRKLQQSGVENE